MIRAAAVTVPVFPCEKCGAVCDVRWIKGVTQKQWEERAEFVRAARARSSSIELFGDWDFRAGHEHGEHLSLMCPRCSWSARRQPLTPDSVTP